MELPDDILDIIRKYYQPISRPDWRQGSYFCRIITKENFYSYHEYMKNVMTVAVRYRGIYVSIWGDGFIIG